MRIVFMGTPEFAVASLRKLHQSSHDILAVVTACDKPAGRGQKTRYSAVKNYALDSGLALLQPESLKDAMFHSELEKLQAELFVVVAFRILPPEVFDMPAKGTINLHASLLPKFRGAAPINWAIINGEKKSGVSTIFIEKSVDAGDLILQQEVDISDSDTAGTLHDKLALLGADLLLKSIDLIERGTAPRHEQQGEVTRAPKLSREMCEIDWQKSATAIRNLVRGLNPAPGAFTRLEGKVVKIYAVGVADGPAPGAESGEILDADAKTGLLRVAAGEGSVIVQELQLEGKRKMRTRDFLAGHKLSAGDRFG